MRLFHFLAIFRPGNQSWDGNRWTVFLHQQDACDLILDLVGPERVTSDLQDQVRGGELCCSAGHIDFTLAPLRPGSMNRLFEIGEVDLIVERLSSREMLDGHLLWVDMREASVDDGFGFSSENGRRSWD